MSRVENSHIVAAAIGAAIGVLSAAGIFMYTKLMESKQQSMIHSHLNTTNVKIAEMETELETLRLQQKNKKKVSRRYTSIENTYSDTFNDTDVDVYSTVDADVDAYSTVDTDFGDDEFLDCSDSESVSGMVETRVVQIIADLDLALDDIFEPKDTEEEKIEDIYKKLIPLTHSDPRNVDVIWRFAKVCSMYADCVSNLDMKTAIISEGIDACEKIITAQNADLHKWFAILIGKQGDSSPMTEKIRSGYRFHNHVTIALKLSPTDPQLHHLLGRFQYEVAGLNWIKRQVVLAVLPDFPSASYEEAIDSFKKAEKYMIKPHFRNKLFLCKSLIDHNQVEKAIHFLKEISRLPAITIDDQRVQAEATELFGYYIPDL